MQNCYTLKQQYSYEQLTGNVFFIHSADSGIFKGIDKKALTHICQENDCIVEMMKPVGSFVLKDVPLIKASKNLDKKTVNEIIDVTVLNNDDEAIKNNFFFGSGN